MQELLEAPAGGTQRRLPNRHHWKISFLQLFPAYLELPFWGLSQPHAIDPSSATGAFPASFFPPYSYSHMRDYTLAKLTETTLPIIQCASRAILFRRPSSYSYSATSEARSWVGIPRNVCLEEVM